MQLSREQTRRQLAHIRLEETSNRVRVPSLVDRKQIHVALGVELLLETLDNRTRARQAVDALLLVGVLRLEVLDAAEHDRRKASHLRNGDRVVQRHAKHGLGRRLLDRLTKAPETATLRLALAVALGGVTRHTRDAVVGQLCQVCRRERLSSGHRTLALCRFRRRRFIQQVGRA